MSAKRPLALAALVAAGCGHAPAPKPHVASPAPLASVAKIDESFREHPPEIGPELPYSPPELRESRMPNGIRLLTASIAGMPTVGIRVIMKGAASLPREPAGDFQWLAHSLTGPTASYDGDALRKTFEEGLATWSITADSDSLTFSMKAIRGDKVNGCIDVLADLVMHPKLEKETIAFVLPPLVERAKTWTESPGYLSRMVAAREVYGAAYPYARVDVAGLERDPKPDEKLIRRLYDAVAQPRQTTVLAVGAVDDALVIKLIAAFGTWMPKAGPALTPVPPVAPHPHARLVVVDRPSAAQSYLTVAAVGPAPNAPDFSTMLVIHELLGARPSSRITRPLFENGALTGGRTEIYPHLRATFFSFEGTSPTARTAEVLRAIDAAFDDLRTRDVSFSELEDAKSPVLRDMPEEFETTEGMLDQFAIVPEFELPLDTYSHAFAAIESVDASDVRKLASARLARDELVWTIVGDWKTLQPSLEALGWGPIDRRDATGMPLAAAKKSSRR